MNGEEPEKMTITNSSWTKASLRWKGSIKTGSIGLRSKNHSTSPNRTINYGKLYVFAYHANGRLAVGICQTGERMDKKPKRVSKTLAFM
jgi:hypothetical protein